MVSHIGRTSVSFIEKLSFIWFKLTSLLHIMIETLSLLLFQLLNSNVSNATQHLHSSLSNFASMSYSHFLQLFVVRRLAINLLFLHWLQLQTLWGYLWACQCPNGRERSAHAKSHFLKWSPRGLVWTLYYPSSGWSEMLTPFWPDSALLIGSSCKNLISSLKAEVSILIYMRLLVSEVTSQAQTR